MQPHIIAHQSHQLCKKNMLNKPHWRQSYPWSVKLHVSSATAYLQIAKADLHKIAASLTQAQDVYKALKAKRAELNKAVEALQAMSQWQV